MSVRDRWLAAGGQLGAVPERIIELPAKSRAKPQGEFLARKLAKLANLPDPQLVEQPAFPGGNSQGFHRQGVQGSPGL